MNCVHCGRPLTESGDVPGLQRFVCAGLDGCQAEYETLTDGTLVEVDPPAE